jgi:hypothetical protein
MGVGYANLWDGEKLVPATHVAVFLETGVWPTLEMMHKCDNISCVRYKHVSEGTHQENMKEMAIKDRGTSTLTNAQVLSLRQEYTKGVTQKHLSKKYKVTNGTVSRIVNNLKRKHITTEESR